MDSEIGILQQLLRIVRDGSQILYSHCSEQLFHCVLSLQVLKMCGVMIDVGKSYVAQHR
jgi:hypothetical protein